MWAELSERVGGSGHTKKICKKALQKHVHMVGKGGGRRGLGDHLVAEIICLAYNLFIYFSTS